MLLHSDPHAIITTLIHKMYFVQFRHNRVQRVNDIISTELGIEVISKNSNNNLRSGFKTPYKFYSNQEGLFYVSVRKLSETIPTLHW